ncbi:Beta-amyrin synthase [Stylosanthes scabra]|uniref:Beta-amyrin synthase n=1 Tax=Stylosanthes scabra TaxID=79078 RepID=A0ABU6QGB1_9FABA|nr:Beta-amyrin synthase [Stylosanthes scabra]
MYRHISKGGWTFSDQDHGWQVSDCIAEGLKSKKGGIGAWEPTGAQEWLELLNPTEFFGDIVVEHESVECTGSAIQALVLFKKLYPEHSKSVDLHTSRWKIKYGSHGMGFDGPNSCRASRERCRASP